MRHAYLMKRTTVLFPDDVEARLRLEARRRGVPMAEVVREAVERHLPAPEPGRPLSFFGVGKGGPRGDSERVDEYVQRARPPASARLMLVVDDRAAVAGNRGQVVRSCTGTVVPPAALPRGRAPADDHAPRRAQPQRPLR